MKIDRNREIVKLSNLEGGVDTYLTFEMISDLYKMIHHIPPFENFTEKNGFEENIQL